MNDQFYLSTVMWCGRGDGEEMVYRKGEFQLSTLDRFYPFHVAVLLYREDRSERFTFYGEVTAFYRTLSDARLQQGIGQGATEHIIFGFKTEETAQAFMDRFGGFRIEPTHKARRLAEGRLCPPAAQK
jgi:hypothetical protein